MDWKVDHGVRTEGRGPLDRKYLKSWDAAQLKRVGFERVSLGAGRPVGRTGVSGHRHEVVGGIRGWH